MSGTRSEGGTNSDSKGVTVEGKSPIDEDNLNRFKSKMRDVNLKLNSLQISNNKQPSADLPSPFSGLGPIRHASAGGPSPGTRSPGPGHSLKLDTTPDALHEQPGNDYISGNQGTRSFSAIPSNSVSSPLLSPLSTSAYPTVARKPVGSVSGGQAAEMQARILALQRSRSKRAGSSPYSAPNLNTQGSNPLARRSSSSSSSTNTHAVLNGLSGPASGSRSSVSTADSTSLESEEDDTAFNSPTVEKSDISAELKFASLSGESSLPGNLPSRINSPGVNHQSVSAPITTATPTTTTKQPLASNGFDPNTIISPTAANYAASGAPVSLSRTSSFRTRQRSSLSARRGLKLDTSALQCDDRGPVTTSSTTSSASQRSALITPHTGLPSAQGKSFRGDCHGIPREGGNRGLFRDYRKYIDIETGSLNFAGKACVHAQGIEFSSGEKFDISIDKLQFISELGSGNYGTVQKVLHTPNGVFMAVKEIRLELDEASLRQIIMELDVLHRCEMSNIIAFYGAFFVEGSVYICMEYMDGGSINKIYQGGIEEKYLKYIVSSVVAGLKQLKEQFNIIHRDVKPTNILCSTTGEIKLCDFGVSGNLVASMARTNIGCQAYMAPERIKVDRVTMGNANQQMTYSAESDIWSLGLSIIEMAKGSYPYPSESFASIFSQLNAIVEDPSPALDPTKYSAEACDFVNQLLCKSPEKRPKYSDIVKHPWLASVDCTREEMGQFVKDRLANQNTVATDSTADQGTLTLQDR